MKRAKGTARGACASLLQGTLGENRRARSARPWARRGLRPRRPGAVPEVRAWSDVTSNAIADVPDGEPPGPPGPKGRGTPRWCRLSPSSATPEGPGPGRRPRRRPGPRPAGARFVETGRRRPPRGRGLIKSIGAGRPSGCWAVDPQGQTARVPRPKAPSDPAQHQGTPALVLHPTPQGPRPPA